MEKDWRSLPRKGDELRDGRLHVAIPESLLQEVKDAAAEEKISVADYVIRALQLELTARQGNGDVEIDFEDV